MDEIVVEVLEGRLNCSILLSYYIFNKLDIAKLRFQAEKALHEPERIQMLDEVGSIFF